MGISYEPGDFDTEKRIEITPDGIKTCASVATLMGWMQELEDMKGDIIAQVEAREICGTDEQEWVDRVTPALAFTGMGLKRVKRRLRELGVNTEPLCKDDQRALDKAREGARFAGNLLAVMGQVLPQETIETIKLMATDRAVEKAFAA